MNSKTWLVLKQTFIRTVFRPSFLIILFLLPIAGFVVLQIVGSMQSEETDASQLAELIMPADTGSKEGYVDLSGTITELPESARSHFVAFENEDLAKAAVDSTRISAYYLVPADFLETGKIDYVRPDFNPLGSESQTGRFEDVVTYNLTDHNQALTFRLVNPLNAQLEVTGGQPARDPGNVMTFFLPYIVAMLFYIVIFSSASTMLSSVTDEKQNRTIEILMTSVTPMQMLTGKIVALGLAGLLQIVIWTGSGLFLLRLSGETLSLPMAFQLPTSILIWAVLFFLLGYALYASMMAGVGALVPNLKEASQATTILVLPMVVPLAMINALSSDPNGAISMAISLFPLTSPVAMMTRLSAAVVPLWQILLALGLLAVTTWLVLRVVAGLFRAQNLLTGQTFSMRVLWNAIVNKA